MLVSQAEDFDPPRDPPAADGAHLGLVFVVAHFACHGASRVAVEENKPDSAIEAYQAFSTVAGVFECSCWYQIALARLALNC